MGTDNYMLDKLHTERRGQNYRVFKKELCKVLGLPCEFDVTGPGDDCGASDAEVVAVVKALVESK